MRAFALSSPEQARSRATVPRVTAGHRWSPVHVHMSHASTPGESLVTTEACPVPPPAAVRRNCAGEPRGGAQGLNCLTSFSSRVFSAN
jgi:hypothetical protein